MWLWYVLSGLLILIAWALWWVLDWGTGIPVAATIAVVIGLATLAIVRALLARRAAKKLENAIAGQGDQQALNARPERRAEIQELQKQLSQGITALKSSKIGRSGKRGSAALYSMPWYMIIGPPGAGKTTALKHSGMVFPFSSGSGGGVRGVGGTRNCDWWFTNEAILLDTAGRYTTESDDRDEWLSFLQFLRKYRPKRPINGIIIAISITELVDANEAQIETTGKKLRARMDEVMKELQMQVPIYLLFTKVDLVAGFAEFYGDMKKSDRSQPWGATLKLDLPKNEPGKLFDAEFDALVQRAHGRVLRRMVMERSREARERLYQFPIELAGLKRNLSDLIAVTFAPNAFQGTPTFRGFYFTSGTQEGKPMDRVLGRMSAAMGIRHTDGGQAQQQNAESKSYFLHDVFMNIIFPDGSIAARSQGEIRRQILMKFTIAMATLTLAAILAVPAVRSYYNNKDFLGESERVAQKISEVSFTDGEAASAKFPPLVPALDKLRELDTHEVEGIPWGMGWGMYTAERVHRPLLKLYIAKLQEGFVLASKQKLEDRLKTANGERYLQDRTTLKLYLMLADPEHLEVEWATGRYTALWVEILKSSSDVSDSELRKMVRPHVAYYFELLKNKKVAPLALDDDLIKRVRAALQSVPVQQRYYDMFVNSLMDERIDEAGDPTVDNLVFPPRQLSMLFQDRVEVLKFFESKRYIETKTYYQVEGPYTEKGRAAVMKLLEKAGGYLEAESWVVPLTKEESPEKIPKYLNDLSKRYESTYMARWMEFFSDIKVKTPNTADEAIELYRLTSTTPYPIARLIEVLEDNTQFKNSNPLEGNDAIAREANRRFNNKLMMYSHGIILNFDLRAVGKEMDVIPQRFRKTTNFVKGDKRSGIGDSRVFMYGELTKRLREKILLEKNKDPALDLRKLNDDLDKARKEAEQLLEGYDDTAKALLLPLLLDPLSVGVRPTLGAPGVDPKSLAPGQKPPTGGPPPPGTWQMPRAPGR